LNEFLEGMNKFGVEIGEKEIEEIFRKIMGNMAANLPRE
jgi:Ca2+-binding EF-hand superfamily protein